MYTAYPRSKVPDFGPARTKTFPWLMAPTTALTKAGVHAASQRRNRWVIDTFDRWMSSRLAPCTVFHCLSGFGRRSHAAAKKRYGALTVCDRGSSHIVVQSSLLAEERRLCGLDPDPVDPWIIERELEEYERCDRIVVPSSFALRTFVESGVPPEKIARIPYGVDLGLFRPLPKEDDAFRVLFVGAVGARKGVRYLLEAMAGLELPGLEVCLVGPLAAEAPHLLEPYEGRFRHVGPVARRELAWQYSQGSVLVLPSVEEGLALVQGQAMACGLPVIGTPNTGAEDLFTDGHEGFIVPIRDPHAIREKVVYLYEHPEERELMGKRALDRVASLAGWETYASDVVSQYETDLAAAG